MQYREINHDLCVNNSKVAKTFSANSDLELGSCSTLNVKLHHLLELQYRGKWLHPGAEEEVQAMCDSSLNRLFEGSDFGRYASQRIELERKSATQDLDGELYYNLFGMSTYRQAKTQFRRISVEYRILCV